MSGKPQQILARCPLCKSGYRIPLPENCSRCLVLSERRVLLVPVKAAVESEAL